MWLALSASGAWALLRRGLRPPARFFLAVETSPVSLSVEQVRNFAVDLAGPSPTPLGRPLYMACFSTVEVIMVVPVVGFIAIFSKRT